MKKIEIDPAILDGISAALKDMQDKLDRAKQAQPEPVEFWEGQLVEVRDADANHWCIRKLEDAVGSVDFYTQGGTHWKQCRPLQDPLILQFKPHVWQTDVCPCSDDTYVHLKFDNGGYLMNQLSGDMDWVDVIGWMPAAGWGGGR